MIFSYLRRNLAFLGLTIGLVFNSFEAVRLIKSPMVDVYENWVSMQQSIYLAALFVGIFSLVSNFKITTIAVFGLMFGMIFEHLDLFDGVIHLSFVSNGIYEFMGFPHFSNNPQYSKLFFYGLIIFIIMIKLILRRHRSITTIFVLLLLLVNIATVLIYHAVIPDGIMRFENNQDLSEIMHVSSLSRKKFQVVCEYHEYNCRLSDDGKIASINKMVMDDKRRSHFEELSTNLEQGTAVSIVKANNLSGIYAIVKTPNDILYEVYSFKKNEIRWKTSVGIFSAGVWLISFFWYFLIVTLAIIHRKVRI